MAAPHASGSAALVIQALKKNNPNLSGRVLVERAKILLSNSAEQLMDTNALPYSPRKQGAGLIKTDKAINAKAYVVNGDGKPNIALKDFTGNKEFTIKIKNISNDELTFKLSNPFGVLSNSIIKGMFIDIKETKVNGASLQFENNEVTVKGNEEAEVKVILNVDNTVPQNIFLEGFIKIEEKENKTPAMTIPFIGFYGKWDEVRVLDSPIWEDDSYYGVACLTDKNGYYLGYVGFDFNTLMPIVSPDMISISPNGDGLFDNVQPNLTFLRNAKEFRVELLDENKNVLRELSYDVNIRKNLGTQYTPAYMNPNWVWDGTLYDVLGNQSVAKEGQYYLRFKSRVDYEGAKWQEVEMPVKVDLTAPEVKVDATKKEGNVFNFNFEGSKDNVGIYGYLIIRGENDNNPEFISALNIEKDVYIPQGINEVAVAALDFAGNIGLEIVKLDNQFITIKKPLETQFEPALGYEVTNRLTPFEFEISPSAKYFLSKVLMTIEKIGNTNKIEKELTDNILDLTKENLEDGQYSLTVALFDKENKCFASVGQKFILDTKAPEFEGLEDKVIEKSSTKYNLEFTVKDNLTGYTLYLNGDLVDVNASQKLEGSIKKYNIPVDVKIGKNEFEFKIVDFAGNQTVKKVKLNVKKIEEINVFVEKDNVVYNTKTAKIVGKIETNKAYDGMYVLVKHNIAKDDATLEEVEDGRFNVINDGTFNIEVSTDSFKVEKYEYQIIKDDEILFEGNFNVCFFPIEVLSPLYFNTNKKEYNLKFKVSEEYNYDKVEIVLNDEVIKTIEKKDINGEVEFKVTGLEKGYNLIGLNVVNEKSAWGIGMINVYVDQDFPTVTVYDEFGNNLSSTPFYNQNNVKIFGFINEELKSLKINGDPVDIAEGAFNKEIVLNEGLNRIFFEIEDMAGNINKYVYKVYCDTVAPCVDTLNYKKDIVVVENDKLELNFKAQDNTLGYRVYINNNQVFTEENEVATGVSKEYSYTINLKEGLNVVRLDVVDFAGNTSGKVIYVYNRINYPISIDNFLSFDRTSDKDLEVELYIPNEYDRNIKQVVLINNNSTNNIVVENTNYELKENKLFVKSEYLKKLDRGNYVLQVEFTNGDKLGFTVNVFDERNSNANLKAIYVNGEELKLNKNGEYVYEVEMEKEYIVTAEAEDNKAKVEITQAQTLPGIAKIKVTAEDGTVVNYEVKLIYPIELSVEDKVEFKAGQDAKVRVNAKNVTLAERVATLIVGLFDEHNRLVQYVSGKYTIKPNDTVQMGANLKLGSNTKGYKIKTFIWELEENMKILSKSFEFIVK
ncbi:MAG: Fn3-like domain-containing protein [Clostridiales bacterium]|nr:Fn3-like domain-containing protein [Clostridiales bacterium]